MINQFATSRTSLARERTKNFHPYQQRALTRSTTRNPALQKSMADTIGAYRNPLKSSQAGSSQQKSNQNQIEKGPSYITFSITQTETVSNKLTKGSPASYTVIAMFC